MSKRTLAEIIGVLIIIGLLLTTCKRQESYILKDGKSYTEVGRSSTVKVDSVLHTSKISGKSKPKAVHYKALKNEQKCVVASYKSREKSNGTIQQASYPCDTSDYSIAEDTLRGPGWKVDIRDSIVQNEIADRRFEAFIETKTVTITKTDTVWLEKKSKKLGYAVIFGIGYILGRASK